MPGSRCHRRPPSPPGTGAPAGPAASPGSGGRHGWQQATGLGREGDGISQRTVTPAGCAAGVPAPAPVTRLPPWLNFAVRPRPHPKGQTPSARRRRRVPRGPAACLRVPRSRRGQGDHTRCRCDSPPRSRDRARGCPLGGAQPCARWKSGSTARGSSATRSSGSTGRMPGRRSQPRSVSSALLRPGNPAAGLARQAALLIVCHPGGQSSRLASRAAATSRSVCRVSGSSGPVTRSSSRSRSRAARRRRPWRSERS